MDTIFDAAIKRVSQGWCQGTLEDGMGNVCAVGALEAAGHQNDDWYHAGLADVAREYVDKVVTEQYPDRVYYNGAEIDLMPTAQFNDHPLTTVNDVVKVMEKARAEFLEAAV